MKKAMNTSMKRTIAALSIIAASISAPAFASSDLDQLQTLAQSEFSLLSKDFVSAASYKAVSPGAPLGVTGFDIGVELTVTKLESASIWKKAGVDVSSLPLPKLHAQKGLPFGFDIGASFVAVPDSNIKLIGGEIRYAIVEGNIAVPSVSVRGAATRLSGVKQLDADTKSLELVVSKGFLNFTPYAGVGHVWGTVTPNVANLKEVSPSANKVFAGLNMNLGLMNFAGEFDRTGDNNSASLKVGFRF
jgi:hypothetical protein